MNRHIRIFAAVVACALTALLGASTADAHNWGCWKQPNRTVPAYITAALSSQAVAAVSEWDTKTILSVPRVSYHSEIHVYDGYYGNTGWAGLASITSYSGCNILHGHARVNRSYSYTSNGYRGIFCQEVGHLFGLDHSNDGGCMGGGYYYSINTYYNVVSHNVNDIYNKYVNSPAMMSPDGELASLVPVRNEGEGPLAGDDLAPGEVKAIAFWHERPRTLEEATALSEAVVTATVMRVLPGPDIVVPVEGLEGGVDRIPTQRILFSVENVNSGRMPARVFELFHTGNETYTVVEDPLYHPGERYLLFLAKKDEGSWRVIAPEGRLLITETGLQPASGGEFLSELRGRNAETVGREVTALTPAREATGEAVLDGGLQLRWTATNPISSRTAIDFALPQASDVKLRVYDAQGRFVRTLAEGRQEGSRWISVQWDGADAAGRTVANGVYFVRLESALGMRSISIVRLQ